MSELLSQALALHRAGQLAAAARLYEQILAARPDDPDAQHLLGVLHHQQGRHEQALELISRAVALRPATPAFHFNLGMILHHLGRLREALPSLKKAAELNAQDANAWAALGGLYRELADAAGAVPCWERVLALDPGRADAHLNLGWALQEEGRPDEAMEHLQTLRRLQPDAAIAAYAIALLHEELGDLAEAEAGYRETLRLQPTHVQAHFRLARLLRGRLPEADRAALEARSADPALGPQERGNLLFGLVAVLDARGEYARAAETARRANALLFESARGRREYDPARQEEFVAGLVRAFGRKFFRRVSGWGLDTRRPVFVFGLPRSGTTLVEQVLASHPKVHGAGELTLGRQSFEALPAALGKSLPPLACVPHLTAAALRAVAGQHLERLKTRDGGRAERIVNKMPDNYLHLGLLAALFPRATFLHCRRDLRDTALSCWLTDFESVPWANDVGEIAATFRQYQRLMAHWKEVLAVPIHDVVYEEMVEDLEGNARRLIAACGLEWDPACLDFHRNRRPVRTASMAQVRRPVSTHSVGRWKNYEAFLADLFAGLPRQK